MKKAQMNIPLLIVIASSIIILVLVSSVVSSEGSSFLGNKNKIECEIGVYNQVFGDVKIETVSCENKGKCLFNSPLSWFGLYDEGKIKMSSSDAEKIIKYDLLEGEMANTKLSICTSDVSVKIEVLNKANNVLDKKIVEV